jgi:glycine oxidase
MAEVAAAGLEIAPRLGECPFLGGWAGLRPATPDGLPYLGAFEAVPNLIAAAGHFRNGILLAPGTAEVVNSLVGGQALPEALAAARPGRAAANPSSH